MSVLISMTLAVIIWSLYPLAAVFGLKTMTSLELIILATVISAITSNIFSVIHLKRKNLLRPAIQQYKNFDRSSYFYIAGAAITTLACHALFFTALTMSHKGGVSLIYESWPIIALIATPFLIKKQWKQVSFKEFLVSLIALGGMATVILSDQNIDLPFVSSSEKTLEQVNFAVLLGYIIAFIGAYTCAMSVVLKAVVAQFHKDLNNTIASTSLSEFYTRNIGVALIIIAYPFLHQYINYSNVHWPSVLFIGVFVMFFGGMFYNHSLVNTDRPTIHIIYYLVPLFAVIVLWLSGESTINSGLFIGGMIIVTSNIYLYFAGRKAKFSDPL